VSANTEVILAAGALQSPQILELSGIGNKDILQEHGIPVVVENVNVGENMQDHPIVCQSFEVKDGVLSGDVLRDPNVLGALVGMYQNGGAGPLGQSNISVAYAPVVDGSGVLSDAATKAIIAPHETTLISPTTQAVRALIEGSAEPAFQFLLFPSQIAIGPNPANMAEHVTPVLPENFLTIMTILNHPFSRGSVHISSGDVNSLPVWDPAYNTNPLDMELFARSMQFVEKLVDSKSPFGSLLKEGGKRLPEIRADDLENAKEIVRQRQISVFHVSGSCAMLPREKGGVVDDRLRVYGVRRLRVVDASVFPLEPSGNLQSTVYAVAEKAADIIKEDRARSVS
jgi:choline dehydrogenase-like flavoprotein